MPSSVEDQSGTWLHFVDFEIPLAGNARVSMSRVESDFEPIDASLISPATQSTDRMVRAEDIPVFK